MARDESPGLFLRDRHCEERSDEAIQAAPQDWIASLRFARNDG